MALLEQVLTGSAPAHLVVVRHALASRPWPLLRVMLSSGPVLAITLLPSPEIPGKVLDLSAVVPGYSEGDVEAEIMQAIADLAPGTQVLLDAADVLVEDHPRAWRILRALVAATLRPGSRLILPVPSSSPLTEDLISASFSPSLALLTPLPSRLVQSTIDAYLLTDPDRLPSLLESAADRGAADLPVLRDMEAPSPDAVVLVLLRKAAGGAKGIQRSVEGFRGRPIPAQEMVDFRPVTVTKVTTHADLNLPFNLSLTDQQREARGAVPLPYAHEGEGADLGMGMDWSDDEEDEEI
ncbi:hypothetical protein CcaverHIS002_0104430 [Cutaneotrichosporon cavernicola]|uniref:Elongator complex protein 5 n=1 Tax=Cutaneotrichosporon cavernicola TaxID=279322 RepID=A0AA48I1A8_9TREE|nr:uncharacterized protein CcaverHIS019_0104370 [Cutaneotrichosporon cavernicola]BEI79914.1 hypothetical protein CcaverHIS002_0104430 [Cutaneotrichosporon cavernicola]BEI87719.1 hypothetical protein CcaverHIS019_0104370 [Cutaneotrichosporon cavernicola]BEI95490.1 hypothetical protein CcaverHIS631_0104390 [Cutaneotrichosporon cavernicola]BEJ03264.1 hypothetical protein CcaverHIS641_0104390 [Cutaneotrichosporon cavernicola]